MTGAALLLALAATAAAPAVVMLALALVSLAYWDVEAGALRYAAGSAVYPRRVARSTSEGVPVGR